MYHLSNVTHRLGHPPTPSTLQAEDDKDEIIDCTQSQPFRHLSKNMQSSSVSTLPFQPQHQPDFRQSSILDADIFKLQSRPASVPRFLVSYPPYPVPEFPITQDDYDFSHVPIEVTAELNATALKRAINLQQLDSGQLEVIDLEEWETGKKHEREEMRDIARKRYKQVEVITLSYLLDDEDDVEHASKTKRVQSRKEVFDVENIDENGSLGSTHIRLSETPPCKDSHSEEKRLTEAQVSESIATMPVQVDVAPLPSVDTTAPASSPIFRLTMDSRLPFPVIGSTPGSVSTSKC